MGLAFIILAETKLRKWQVPETDLWGILIKDVISHDCDNCVQVETFQLMQETIKKKSNESWN